MSSTLPWLVDCCPDERVETRPPTIPTGRGEACLALHGCGRSSPAQYAPGLLDVAGDLGAQRGGVRVLRLVTEPGHEAQLQALLVEVPREVEKVGLDPELGLVEGRP